MLIVNWLHNGQRIMFSDPDDFQYWVKWHMIRFKPYQLWNLSNAEVYADVYRYIGRKYLGELIVNKSEDRVRAMMTKRLESKQTPVIYLGHEQIQDYTPSGKVLSG